MKQNFIFYSFILMLIFGLNHCEQKKPNPRTPVQAETTDKKLTEDKTEPKKESDIKVDSDAISLGNTTGGSVVDVSSTVPTNVSPDDPYYDYYTYYNDSYYDHYDTDNSTSSYSTLPNSSSSSSGSSSSTTTTSSLSRSDKIIKLSKLFVGFSYWWGGAAFKIGSTDKGKCWQKNGENHFKYHSGDWGADCSGYVSKMWQLPVAMPLEKQTHPHTTKTFMTTNHKYWNAISRSAAKKADAFVYNNGESGHIVIYEKGDDWNQAWVYEAKGCYYGVLHNTKAIGSQFSARRVR